MAIGAIGGIDGGRIEAMIAQLKSAATKPTGAAELAPLSGPPQTGKVDFAAALKNSIGEVSSAQLEAGAKGRAFTMGDDSVSLSDVMVSMQKASIGFQATVQVRNKVVQAYQEMMNMQV